MLAELFAFGLLRANVCAALVIMAILVVRGPVRRRLGAQAGYTLWLAVPAVMAMSTFPGLHPLSEGAFQAASAVGRDMHLSPRLAEFALAAWLAGVVAWTGRFRLAHRRFERAAVAGLAGPAVRGVFWPRLVTPADYRNRFSAAEQILIAAHEREHIRRQDPFANLLLAALQALSWFNPLVPFAAAAMRLDQEMACDEAVLERRPQARAAYARALLKVQVGRGTDYAPAAFAGVHPLEFRLRAMAPPPARRRFTGMAIAVLPLIAVLGAWALAPSAFRSSVPPAVAALLIDLTPRAPSP